jgi:hypothetical protein
MIADEDDMMRMLEMLAALSEEQRATPQGARQDSSMRSPVNSTDVAFGMPGEAGAPTQEIPDWLLEMVDRLGSQEFQSWMRPLEGPSRAMAGVVRGENPLARAAYGDELFGEALVDQYDLPEWAGMAAEFVVPDPTGARKATDLLPLLSFVSPRIMNRIGRGQLADDAVEAIRARGESLGGRDAFERALTEGPQNLFSAKVGPTGAINLRGTREVSGELLDGIPGPNMQTRLSPQEDGSYFFNWTTNRESPGNKDFLEAMDYLLRVADETGVVLKNMPAGSGRLDDSQLYNLYGKLGFTINPSDGTMIRRPFNISSSPEEKAAELAARQKANAEILTGSSPRTSFANEFDTEVLSRVPESSQNLLPPEEFSQAMRDLDELLPRPSFELATQPSLAATSGGGNATSGPVSGLVERTTTFDNVVEPLMQNAQRQNREAGLSGYAGDFIHLEDLVDQKRELEQFITDNLQQFVQNPPTEYRAYEMFSELAPNLVVDYEDAMDIILSLPFLRTGR